MESFLHSKIDGKYIIHWANDVSDLDFDNPKYLIPKYLIHKLDTEEYYDSAYDLTNTERERAGLDPYYYEPTDIPIDE